MDNMENTDNSDSLKKQLVDEMKNYFERKFSDLKRDVREDSEWAVENVRKKVRADNAMFFKSNANKRQYMFNSEINDCLESCLKAIELRNANKAKEYISEAQAKIKHRNKLIRIADNSATGWLTIQEYENNEAASDSDDDKKIRRAEERARTKLDKSRKSESPANPDSELQANAQLFRRNPGQGRYPMARHQFGSRFQNLAEVVCFVCGKPGHFATGCALRVQNPGSVQRPMGEIPSVASSTSSSVGAGKPVPDAKQ